MSVSGPPLSSGVRAAQSSHQPFSSPADLSTQLFPAPFQARRHLLQEAFLILAQLLPTASIVPLFSTPVF